MSRILFSTIAAATLFAAAPALAAEGTTSKQPCSCCSDGSIHEVDHPLRDQSKKSDTAQRPAPSDDPYARNQSFGG